MAGCGLSEDAAFSVSATAASSSSSSCSSFCNLAASWEAPFSHQAVLTFFAVVVRNVTLVIILILPIVDPFLLVLSRHHSILDFTQAKTQEQKAALRRMRPY